MTEIAYPSEDRNLIPVSIKHADPTATLKSSDFLSSNK
jgi:hypothetical protein